VVRASREGTLAADLAALSSGAGTIAEHVPSGAAGVVTPVTSVAAISVHAAVADTASADMAEPSGEKATAAAALAARGAREQGREATFGEIAARSARLARRLAALGVGAETPVGVYLGRDARLAVAALAVMRAGGIYLPLDPSHPEARLAFMLQDAGARLVIAAAPPPFSWAASVGIVEIDEGEDGPDEAPEGEPAAPLPLVDPRQPAYLLYTSGSTGWPKGVVVTHGALANLLAAAAERLGISAADRLLGVTPISFDLSVADLLLPFATGAELTLATREEAADGARLGAALRAAAATLLQATPATFRLLIAAGGAGPGLRVWSSGEALPPDLAAQLLAAGVEVWNFYGPT
jgi:non-ribosomal peptide synthetase component F